MKQPEGFEVDGKEKHAYKLNKSIYGLKQSAKVWNDKLNDVSKKLNFTQGIEDHLLMIVEIVKFI